MTEEIQQEEQIFVNKIAVISYNSENYSKNQKPQIYSVRNPELVNSNKQLDYQSPPWVYNNNINISMLDGWRFLGVDSLVYQLNSNTILYTWMKTEGYKLSAFTSNSNEKSITSNISSNLFQHGVISFPVRIPTCSVYQYLSSYLLSSQIEMKQFLYNNSKQEIVQGIIQDFNYTDKLHETMQAKVNTQLQIFQHKVRFKGIVYCSIDTLNPTNIISSIIDYDPEIHKRNEKKQITIVNDMNYLSGLAFNIKSIEGAIINYTQLSQQIQYFLRLYNNINVYGWLYGSSDMYFSEIFYTNQLSSYINQKVYKKGKVFSSKRNGTIYDQFSGNLYINLYGNEIQGYVVKQKNTNLLKGTFEGSFIYDQISTYVHGDVIGRVDSYSLKSFIISNNKKGKSLDITWLSGQFYNKKTMTDTQHKIIDIKKNNALGRKNLIKYNSLNGQNLNTASKNFFIYNNPYMVQTWKIIQYQDDINQYNTNSNVILNNQGINLKTYINSTQTVKNKMNILDKVYSKPLDLNIKRSGNYYIYWTDTKNIQLQITNEVKENRLLFSGPFETYKLAQFLLKKFATVKNLKLKDMKNTTYTFEHTNLEV